MQVMGEEEVMEPKEHQARLVLMAKGYVAKTAIIICMCNCSHIIQEYIYTHGNPHYAVLKAGSAGGNGGKGGDGGKGTPGGAGGPITVVLLSDSKTKRMF